MLMRLDLHSLKTRVVLFTVVVFLVGIWALQAHFSRLLHADMEAVISGHQFSTANTIALNISTELAERMRALEIISGYVTPELLRNPAALQSDLQGRRLLSLMFNAGVFVTRLDGIAVVDVPRVPGRTGTYFGDRPNLITAMTQGKTSVGGVVIGKALKTPVFTIASPIRDKEGHVIGSIVGVTELDKPNFLDRVTQNQYGRGGNYLLISSAQRLIILSSDRRQIMTALPTPGASPGIDRFVQGYQGTQYLTSTLGVPVIASAKGIPLADWYLAVNSPVEDAFAPIAALERNMLLAALVLTLLVTSLIWWFLGRELAPLLTAAKTLSKSKDPSAQLKILPVYGANEIRALVTAINQQTEARKARDIALAASELRYRSLFANLRTGVIIESPDSTILLSNESALVMLGLSEDQLLGRTAFDPAWNIIHDDGSPFPSDQLPVVIAIATGQPVRDVVMGVYRPVTGDRAWLSVSAIPERNPDGTVQQVVVSFNDITDSLLAQRALVSSEARLRAIVEVSPIPMALNNHRLEITYLNPAFVHTFGYSQSEIPTLADWWPRAYPDADYRQWVADSWNAELQAAAHSGNAFKPMEVTIQSKDGTRKTVLASASMLAHSGDGEHLVVMFDITQRIEAQKALQLLVQDKEALLREVHHRVKNNLQIVTSLLRLESVRSTEGNTRAVLNDMQGRIRSMALLHESLYRSGTFASIDLGGYLKQLSTQAFRAQLGASAIELRLDLGSVQVTMDQATPCGLLVNELISNCLKHGFPDGRSGNVCVELQPEAGGPQWRLCVKDTGVGLPVDFQARGQQSMGLQLVTDLAQQLGGTVRMDHGPHGAAVTITFTP